MKPVMASNGRRGDSVDDYGAGYGVVRARYRGRGIRATAATATAGIRLVMMRPVSAAERTVCVQQRAVQQATDGAVGGGLRSPGLRLRSRPDTCQSEADSRHTEFDGRWSLHSCERLTLRRTKTPNPRHPSDREQR